MEESVKRVKSSGFESDADARQFMAVAHIGPTDMGGLLKENWIHVLTQNPELSVDDILRICSLNKRLKALCDTGVIWDEIYKRQFGLEDFAQALVDMRALAPEDGPESRVALARLFTRRYELMRERSTHTNLLFKDNADGVIRVYLWKKRTTNVIRIDHYAVDIDTPHPNVFLNMLSCLQRHNIEIRQVSQRLWIGPSGISQAEKITGYRKIIFCAMLTGFFPRGWPGEDTRMLHVGNSAVGEPLCSVCGDVASHQCDRCSLPYCGNECFDARPMAPYCGGSTCSPSGEKQ